ncbi:MAG: hypothetical protein B6D68_01340 [spirochete symbiont of Stewartia floridana]|nr:MAG: hypothetical protein B6D68_01340 [spirochete symbiont of Stewartia floridana]
MIDTRRTTKETDIRVILDMGAAEPCRLQTGLPFFNHMLNAMAFHGKFRLEVEASGDIEVDPHHLVEDTGLVIGEALHQYRLKTGGIARYGQAVIPMDDALSEAVVDFGGRPYLVFNADWPQSHAGEFDASLIKEFWQGMAVAARINLHLQVRYAENTHHAAEALFKAAGLALSLACRPANGGEETMSTKGSI